MEPERAQNLVGIPALTSVKISFVGILDQTSNFAQKKAKKSPKSHKIHYSTQSSSGNSRM
jgi:hypothetical protein